MALTDQIIRSLSDEGLKLSQDTNLNGILQNVVTDVKGYADRLMAQISELSDIGRSLSGIRDRNTLLEVIVKKAKAFTHADSGLIFLKEKNHLHCMILQNESMELRCGGTTGNAVDLPLIELKLSSVSAFVALHGRSMNISDLYNSDIIDFKVDKSFDQMTNYYTQSLLAVPIRDQDYELIGVLMLLNALDTKTGEIVSFSPESENLIESLVSHATMAIGNINSIAETENLFEAFVQVMASAIDEKSPTTGGHIRRVSELTLVMAETVDRIDSGCFKDIRFDDERMHQLRLASWMHDIGKVTTPVEIMEKAKKLQTLFDRIHLVDLRMKYILERVRNSALQQKVDLLTIGGAEKDIEELDAKTRKINVRINEIRSFLRRCNEPYESLNDGDIERLEAIANLTFLNDEGHLEPYLTADELENLSIRCGSITEGEREIMKDHAYITLKMLEQIPFTRNLKNIPIIASSHHEFINGRGYPLGLKGEEIPFEARLMAVTDIAEALTADDRPYKKSIPLTEVYTILRRMASKGQLDHDLVELFINENVYDKYRERAKTSSIPRREYSPNKNHLINIKRKVQAEKTVSGVPPLPL
jgi:HD-GYP domain-containing protein (c-di-GMP phosphodiesterase class II)